MKDDEYRRYYDKKNLPNPLPILRNRYKAFESNYRFYTNRFFDEIH